MFILWLNCDCIRDPGWNRFGNIVSHLLIAAKLMEVFLYLGSVNWCGAPLKTCGCVRLLGVGLLEQAKGFLYSVVGSSGRANRRGCCLKCMHIT